MTTPFLIPGLGLLQTASPSQASSANQSHDEGAPTAREDHHSQALASQASDTKSLGHEMPVAMDTDQMPMERAESSIESNLVPAISGKLDAQIMDVDRELKKVDMISPGSQPGVSASALLEVLQPVGQENVGGQDKHKPVRQLDNGDDGIESSSDGSDSSSGDDNDDSDHNPKSGENGEAGEEWQDDSSPCQSSDSDSDSDADDTYINLSPEEMARVLMEQESLPSKHFQVRTANEKTEDVIPKPDVTITENMKLVLLGQVLHVVEDTIVIQGDTPGEYQVIDTGSVVCSAERVVLGAVSDVIGRVHAPMYTIRYSSVQESSSSGLTVGAKVYYPPELAKFVFTQPLRSLKGNDASNLYDEEVGEDEVEFSDDEQEREYKRNKRAARDLKKQGRGRGRGRGAHGGRGVQAGHADANRPTHDFQTPSEITLNYDDIDTEPYHPLRRPDTYVETTASEERPSEFHGGRGSRGGSRFRGSDQGHNQGNFGGRARGGGDGRFRGKGNGFRGRSDGSGRHEGQDREQGQRWNRQDGRDWQDDSANTHYQNARRDYGSGDRRDAGRQDFLSRPRSSHGANASASSAPAVNFSTFSPGYDVGLKSAPTPTISRRPESQQKC